MSLLRIRLPPVLTNSSKFGDDCFHLDANRRRTDCVLVWPIHTSGQQNVGPLSSHGQQYVSISSNRSVMPIPAVKHVSFIRTIYIRLYVYCVRRRCVLVIRAEECSRRFPSVSAPACLQRNLAV